MKPSYSIFCITFLQVEATAKNHDHYISPSAIQHFIQIDRLLFTVPPLYLTDRSSFDFSRSERLRMPRVPQCSFQTSLKPSMEHKPDFNLRHFIRELRKCVLTNIQLGLNRLWNRDGVFIYCFACWHVQFHTPACL